MPHVTSLRALAEQQGILSSYVSQSGAEHRSTSDDTRVAILAAMGYDASTESRARVMLAEMAERDMSRIVAPVRVVREAELPRGAVSIRVPQAWGVRAGERVEYVLELRGAADDEARGRPRDVIRQEGKAEVGEGGVVTLGLERGVALGYYELGITIAARGRASEARQRLIVAPPACVTPVRRAFGIIANLYSVRGARSWGVGDLTDLAELARWSGSRGASFVGVNPLHALRDVGGEVSPYSPVSRLYRNQIYLDIEAIPELAECEEARALLASEPVLAELARLRASDRVEYARKSALARPILAALHRCFVGRHGSPPSAVPTDRARAYAEYLRREGRALHDFALFAALDEELSRGSEAPLQWQQWPTIYHDPHTPEVAAFALSHELEVDFHQWVQFELDRQLGAAAEAGFRSGLTIGLYQDLAVASAPYGSDAWMSANLHAVGVSIGAPPDNYSASGQNWGLSPLDPHRLFEDGYRFWTALISSALRHAGALRIDHVLGLFRQFWIPHGMTGAQGAYVRFPTNDLLGILALESVSHHAVIVGEDLGTVPPEVPGTLREWGILGTRVMLFEREGDGAFRPAASYEPLSLATADTHDTPTLAGFWKGRDIELAAELGLLPASADANPDASAALRARERDRQLLTARLVADGAVAGASAAADSPLDGAELRNAVHRFLCSTPAALVGISLDDLTGEEEPVNIPGVSAEDFSSWMRRMRVAIDELEASDGVDALDGCSGRGQNLGVRGSNG